MPVILGIDPALARLGWGVINNKTKEQKLLYIASGVIKTSANISMPYRLANITEDLEKIILHYNPVIVAMEETFVNMNAASSMKLGYARGAIMALIGRKNLHFQEFKPNLVKKTVVGSGHAEKQQVLHMIKILMPDARHIEHFDEADALAVAYTSSVYNRN